MEEKINDIAYEMTELSLLMQCVSDTLDYNSASGSDCTHIKILIEIINARCLILENLIDDLGKNYYIKSTKPEILQSP